MALGKVLLWHVQNKVLHEIWARLDGGLMPIESFSSSEFFVFDSTFGKGQYVCSVPCVEFSLYQVY